MRTGPLRERTPAWAYWSANSTATIAGTRTYTALQLPGTFSDKAGTPPAEKPHLEIPARTLRAPDPCFPSRLAAAGNTLLSPVWFVPEVLAAKRVIFATDSATGVDLLTDLDRYREDLVARVLDLRAHLATGWDSVARDIRYPHGDLLISHTTAIPNISIQSLLPDLLGGPLRVTPEPQRAARSGASTARSVGVWQCVDTAGRTIPVLTPRITQSLLASRGAADPGRESTLALTVHYVLLRMLAPDRRDHSAPLTATSRPATGHLRAAPARGRHKTPQATATAAAAFTTDYPTPEAAWAALNAWTQRQPAPTPTLSVTFDAFVAAHRAVTGSSSPPQADVDVVLPLAWVPGQGPVRLTYVTRSA